MKGKIAKILGVGLVLVLVVGLSLVPAIPVAASPDVSDVWVDLDVYTANTSTIYHVYFTPGADLAKDVDTITVFFPIDTVPTDAVTVTVDPDGDAVAATTGTATADVAGYRLEVTTPVDITAGNEVRLDILSVTNPTTADDYTLNVYTSQETTQVESNSYTIDATSVSSVEVVPTTATAGAVSEYTIDFVETTTLAVWDTITVIFPTGTGIPAMAASDVAIDTYALDTVPVIAGRFVTLTIPEGWSGDGSPQIVFASTAGITNPTYASTGYIGKVYTSKALGIVNDSSAYTIAAASISQMAFDAVNSDAEVMVTTASDIRTAELIIQTKDQYGNLKGVPGGVTVTFDLSSSSGTGVFTSNAVGTAVIEDVDISGTDDAATFYYKDTTVGTATITAENTAHGWSDTWDVEVTSETVVELWDGDTLVGEYTTITAAVGDALAGNVIKVGPGTYTLTSAGIGISGKDRLTLESTDGAASTIIDASAVTQGYAINIFGEDVTVEGFTVADSAGGDGDGIWIMASSVRATVKNNVFTNTKIGVVLTYDPVSPENIVDGATVSGNVIENSQTGIDSAGCAKDCTISGNTITDCSARSICLTGGTALDPTQGNTISGNTITGYGDWGRGIHVKSAADERTRVDDNVIEANTISGGESHGIEADSGLTVVTDLVITHNIITDNTGDGILIGKWDATNVIKFNTISGNTDYGIEATVSDVDATHNWWGTTVASEIAGMVTGTGLTYEPWLLATVSAGEWAISATSLDAQATVGVKVSGVDTKDIGAARYTENPMAAPEFTPLEDGFFDVYVSAGGNATEIGIKFYDAAITSDSVVYVWDAFEEVWTECSDQAYNATYGYIWVKVRTAAADVPTVPLISDLAGTPFAISGEEAPPEFDPWEYDTDEDGVMEIGEVLTAISDYFAGEITITQVLEVIALYF